MLESQYLLLCIHPWPNKSSPCPFTPHCYKSSAGSTFSGRQLIGYWFESVFSFGNASMNHCWSNLRTQGHICGDNSQTMWEMKLERSSCGHRVQWRRELLILAHSNSREMLLWRGSVEAAAGRQLVNKCAWLCTNKTLFIQRKWWATLGWRIVCWPSDRKHRNWRKTWIQKQLYHLD